MSPACIRPAGHKKVLSNVGDIETALEYRSFSIGTWDLVGEWIMVSMLCEYRFQFIVTVFKYPEHMIVCILPTRKLTAIFCYFPSVGASKLGHLSNIYNRDLMARDDWDPKNHFDKSFTRECNLGPISFLLCHPRKVMHHFSPRLFI